jgi:hypothetical protein
MRRAPADWGPTVASRRMPAAAIGAEGQRAHPLSTGVPALGRTQGAVEGQAAVNSDPAPGPRAAT